eukprot:CAMPEP_0176044560 /NCGR_PEP_ID=MMETSP0120_2-20121206/22116_1 /TAXON_ID=160619 /ORGANISM="Kryptoperidinium foliaceum, Strain CCMP 1326" /LENGTH=218 /DNA_ID=CAMNT_0017377965 /DNA_START=274 /DNA_END=928 /DNA_ORIENTATION=+
MNQDATVLTDSRELEELPSSLEARGEELGGIVAHGQSAIPKPRILLMEIRNSLRRARRGAVQHIPDVVLLQRRLVPSILGITDPNPIEVLVLEVAHRLVFANLGSGSFACFFFFFSLLSPSLASASASPPSSASSPGEDGGGGEGPATRGPQDGADGSEDTSAKAASSPPSAQAASSEPPSAAIRTELRGACAHSSISCSEAKQQTFGGAETARRRST